jgi:hypothetical protein
MGFDLHTHSSDITCDRMCFAKARGRRAQLDAHHAGTEGRVRGLDPQRPEHRAR